MSDFNYTSKVRIEHLGIPFNRAQLPASKEPVMFGVHGRIAEHYRIPMDTVKPCSTTLDYIVASAGGCLTGTFAGILKMYRVNLVEDGLTADVNGEIEREPDNVLIIKRNHVTYHLSTASGDRENVDRAYEMHAANARRTVR